MPKNTGKQYELFVRDLYAELVRDDRFATVEHDVKIDGGDGLRQLDVVIRTQVAGHPLVIVIECRDYASRLDVGNVDGLHSKVLDINASKGVLVSRRGFSKTAKKKAKRLGIALCLASEAREVLEELDLSVPVRVNEIAATINAKMNITVERPNQTFNNRATMTINGVHLLDRLHTDLLSGVEELPTTACSKPWLPKGIQEPFYIQDVDGAKVGVTNLEIHTKFLVRYYFGLLQDIPGVAAHHDTQTEKTTFMFGRDDVPNMIPSLTEYRKPKDIPANHQLTINLIHVSPEIASKY